MAVVEPEARGRHEDRPVGGVLCGAEAGEEQEGNRPAQDRRKHCAEETWVVAVKQRTWYLRNCCKVAGQTRLL